MTMFPTTISATAGALKDRTDGTWMYLTTLPTRTSADVWVNHGRYIRNFTYGGGWLFHDADKSPYVVTPWLMPNAVPYGIMQTYDEIPWDNYDKISPSPDTPITSRWWEWLDQNAKRRVNLLIILDYLVGNYTPTAEGIDKSWAVHGTKRMANTSTEYKEWLKGLEGKRIGFGIHGYHHDYPWQWEFRSVTNTTWIDLTWNQLYQDFKILGLSNNSLLHFKAAGFRMQPHGLEILTKYGVKILHVAFERGYEPLYQVYVDSYGRKLVLVIYGLSPDGELAGGKEVSYVYNALKSNLTNLGLVNLGGHFLINDTLYNDFNSVFTQVETYFGDNLDYFLVEEISNYWHEVLLPLEYTYNTTTIEKTTNDSRLTLKIINPPYSVNKGLVHNSTISPSSFILYAPNVQTLDFLFTRLSGYAQLSNMVFSANRMSFLLNAPSETTSTTKIYCSDKGEPKAVYATNGNLTWSYNASTKILTLNLLHYGPPAEMVVDWKVADLNALMFDEFHKWDAMMTRYISINGSLVEYYDYSRAPNYSKLTLANPLTYFNALISFYEATNDEYYLTKLKAMIDAYIEGSGPNGFYTFDCYKGEIFYVWYYRYDIPPIREADFSAMTVMGSGVSAVWLHQKTGEQKYKNLADRIARESYGLAIVNNATDMAWKHNYCFNGTEEDAKIGVNRQTSIAYFYSIYAKYINSTYASYIPKILNWAWRAQLASGGLSYDIGQTSESKPYTALSLWYALKAYSNIPEQFSESLKTKMNSSITWLLRVSGAQYYLENHIISSVLVLAVKSGFISSPTSDYLAKTKTYVYGSLKLARYAEKGFDVALNDYSTGYRWQVLFMGALFSTYPLPSNLNIFTLPKISFEEYQTGRYYWQGWAIQPSPTMTARFYVGDSYGQTGWDPYPFIVLASHKAGIATRSITERGYYFQTWTNYTDTKVLTYFYPTTVIFGNVTGPSRILILSFFPADARLRVENGTIYNLGDMGNGTQLFGNDFLLWRNSTSMKSRQTIFVHSPKTNMYNFTRYANRIILTSDASDYNITVSYLGNWAKISSLEDAFSLMQNITDTYHSLTPLTLTTILSHYKDLVDSKSPLAPWWDTYKNSVSTNVKLIAHNNPEKVSLTSWDYGNQRLTFTVSAPSGITSTTKVYCGDNGEPKAVYATNGTVSWSHNTATKVLTLNVTHDSPTRILVYWKFPGDIDGDGYVGSADFSILAGAYGSSNGDPVFKPEADIDGDDYIGSADFSILAGDYGKTYD